MNQNGRRRAERLSISFFEEDRAIVEAKMHELEAQQGTVNFSLALRTIIREWDEMVREAAKDTTPDCA